MLWCPIQRGPPEFSLLFGLTSLGKEEDSLIWVLAGFPQQWVSSGVCGLLQTPEEWVIIRCLFQKASSVCLPVCLSFRVYVSLPSPLWTH